MSGALGNRKRTNGHGLWVLLLLICALGSPGCGKPPSTQEGHATIRVGYQPFTSDLAIFVSVEQGFFLSEGLSPQLTMFRSTTDFLNALVADRIDVAGIIGSPTLFARECESPGLFRAFLPAVETEASWVAAFLVPKASSVQSIAELKGKVVGTYSGTTQALNLKYILGRFLNPNRDLTTLQVSSELQLQALAAGKFDALLTIEPYRSLALQKGIARVLEDNPRCKYIMCPFPASAQAVSAAYLERSPAKFHKYYRALRRAVAFIETHPLEARTILPKYTELDAATASASNLYEWVGDEEVDKGRFQALADLYSDSGVLPRRVDVSRMFATPENLGLELPQATSVPVASATAVVRAR